MSPKCWRSARLFEIDLVDFVYYLSHQLAGLHVVVGIFEDIAHNAATFSLFACGGKFLELRENLGVHEREEFIARDAFGTAQTGKWVVKRETNPMDNVTTTAEVLVSEGKDAGLIISCTGKQIELVVRTAKVVDDALPSVRVKFDDHEVVRSTWYRIENYKGMVPPDLPRHSEASEAIIKAISLSKKLYFAYNAYQEGEIIVSFVVEGLPFSQCEK